MDHQNWEYTTFDSRQKNAGYKNQQQINKAGQQGKDIEAVNKNKLNKNVASGKQIYNAMMSEDLEVPTISLDFKLALQKARQAKNFTQKELAMRVNEQQGVINDYEAGRAIPNPQIINKLEKALGARLPRQKKQKKKNSEDN